MLQFQTVAQRCQHYLKVCGRGDPQVPELLDDGTPVIDELIPGTTDAGHENDEAPVLEELEPNDELDSGLDSDDAKMLLLLANSPAVEV